jgi:outer membrane cobalamin receptor
MVRLQWLAVLLPLVLIGCTPPHVGADASDRSQIITEDEVEASHAVNAFDVIQKLHANFLTSRGESSLSKTRSSRYPTVYVDEQEFGSVSSLRTIPATQISMIRFYHAWEAATKYGTDKTGGVIEITTRR